MLVQGPLPEGNYGDRLEQSPQPVYYSVSSCLPVAWITACGTDSTWNSASSFFQDASLLDRICITYMRLVPPSRDGRIWFASPVLLPWMLATSGYTNWEVSEVTVTFGMLQNWVWYSRLNDTSPKSQHLWLHCTGPEQDWTCQQSVMGKESSHKALLSLTAELLAIDRLGRGTHCLQLRETITIII